MLKAKGRRVSIKVPYCRALKKSCNAGGIVVVKYDDNISLILIEILLLHIILITSHALMRVMLCLKVVGS